MNDESEKFRKFQDHSPVAFMAVNENWVLEYANPAFLKDVHQTLGGKDIIGRNIFEIWEGLRDSVFHEHYARAMMGEPQHFEGHYKPYNEWYSVYAYPLFPGIGIISHNITHSKRLENDLQDAIQARDRFLSIASHELNTPLTSLKLHTQMMSRMQDKGVSGERLTRFFLQTDMQISRIKRLVDDMLDASRIRDGRLALSFNECCLKIVVEETVERFAPLFQSLGMPAPKLEVTSGDFPCNMDVARIEQVVSNLLTNAFKYGNGKPVKVKLFEEYGRYVLSVKDQGPGVPTPEHQKIFEQYYRGNKLAGQGLGLGLFIVKQIVQAHEGIIYLESTPGKGSTFVVKLPKPVLVD
jgi:signal transduction histidine kinase